MCLLQTWSRLHVLPELCFPLMVPFVLGSAVRAVDAFTTKPKNFAEQYVLIQICDEHAISNVD